MLNVVTSERFHVLLQIGQYLPFQMNYSDKILLLFSHESAPEEPLQGTLNKLSLLPWEDKKEAGNMALPLLQQGWQQLNSMCNDLRAYKRALTEFYKGQLYCFKGISAVVNENKTHPQIIFDYISKAKEAFISSQKIYPNASSKNAIILLDSLLKNSPAKNTKISEDEDACSYSSLGRLYVEQKKWALAYKNFKIAHKKCPNSPIHQTEKTLAECFKQISELYNLCQSAPIVFRKTTTKRYLEIIHENLSTIEGLTSTAHRSLILTEQEHVRWLSALSHIRTKEMIS